MVEGQGWLIGLGSAAQRAVADGPNTYDEKAPDCALAAGLPMPPNAPPCGPMSEKTAMKRKAASATQLDRLSRARRARSDAWAAACEALAPEEAPAALWLRRVMAMAWDLAPQPVFGVVGGIRSGMAGIT